jgi:hypothetical protein
MFQQLIAGPGGQLWMRGGVCGVYMARAGEQPFPLYEHDAPVITLAVSPDGWYVASGDNQGEILIYGMREGRYVGVTRAWGRIVAGLVWEPEQMLLVSLSTDPDGGNPVTEHWHRSGERAELLLDWGWDAVSQWSPTYDAFAWIVCGMPMAHFIGAGNATCYLGHQRRGFHASYLAWSPDGRFIASVDDRHLLVWEAATGEERWTRPHSMVVSGLAWSDAVTLVTPITLAHPCPPKEE